MIAIKEIEPGTLGARAGLERGDRILTINGASIDDLIDFQVNSSEHVLTIEVERAEQVYEVEIERTQGESFGLSFEEMRLRRCNNKCVFCFLHQMPRGMRRSLYFEDDDYRLSFLHGSYVTLTNMADKDLERIVEQRLSPQYISVHATEPELRQQMLGRRKATPPILSRIEWLAEHDIDMHVQVVLCPGLNDGDALDRTISDLKRYHPSVRSLALVPVGLTRFRSHLPELKSVDEPKALEYLVQAETWGDRCCEEIGERLVFAADELFLRCRGTVPEAGYYSDFPQIENGIGIVRDFLDTWEAGRASLPASILPQRRHIAIVTGQLARLFLEPLITQAEQIAGLRIELIALHNDYFGHGITVSGLLTGADIEARLKGGNWDTVLLPPNCINGDGVTLDDLTIPELERRCGVPLAVGEYDLAASLKRCLAGGGAKLSGRGRQLSELGFTISGDGGAS